MWPDERAVTRIVVPAVRRARILAAAEALAWGAAAAVAAVWAFPVVTAVVLAWRWRQTGRSVVIRALERMHRDLQNVLVTADEIQSGLLQVKPDVRTRVFDRLAAATRNLDLRAALPPAPAVRAASVAVAAWLVLWASTTMRPVRTFVRSISGAVERVAGRGGATALHLTVTLTPPAYTHLEARTERDPAQIAAVEGTQVEIQIEQGVGSNVSVEHDAIRKTLSADRAGRFLDRFALRKTGYYAVDAASGGRRVIPLAATPDALPSVTVTLPGRDLVLASAEGRVEFDVHATDDFGLRQLALEYTKVSGSGEQFEFQEGQIPIATTRTSDREWRGRAAPSLTNLQLGEGDMLVYRAVAADARPGEGVARSDAFFIQISKLAVASGDAFTVQEEETRYALSQQMLIVKTGRLEQKRTAMAEAEFKEAALDLAVEQRMIRAEFVFMLGGEIEDEDVEAAQSSELQEGRLQNRGQRDLRAATIAMSQAEKFLTAASMGEALTAERAAVTALQRAFARDRYILRALGSRTELDMKRRLTGSLAGVTGGRRARPDAAPNRRAALLQDLLSGIGSLRQDADRPESASRAVTLAREALLVDAVSKSLRNAAADLQRAADAWPSASTDARRAALDAVASTVAAEAARALTAPAAFPSFASPSLAGGFADALRGGVPR